MWESVDIIQNVICIFPALGTYEQPAFIQTLSFFFLIVQVPNRLHWYVRLHLYVQFVETIRIYLV